MTRWQYVVGAACLIAAMAIGYAIYVHLQLAPLRADQARLVSYCRRVAWAMRDDRRGFESDNPRTQEFAKFAFLTGQATFHDVSSVETCLDDVPPEAADCARSGDVACKLALARKLEAALARRYP